jgi:hypothetical protein
MMGAYELMEGKLVSGKGVWQRKGAGLEAYLYYAGISGQWWVGRSQANMEAGEAGGDINVDSEAMTPDAATEQWKVYDGTSEAWQDAPKITTRICTEYERQAMVREAEEEATAKAKEAPIIVLQGQEAGEPQHSMMGAYELMEGKLTGTPEFLNSKAGETLSTSPQRTPSFF